MGVKVVNPRRKRPVALVAFASRSRSRKYLPQFPLMVIIASSFVKVFYINANCHYSNSINALDFSRDSWVS